MTVDLVTFLRARLDEDHGDAQRISNSPESAWTEPRLHATNAYEVVMSRQRVLREVEAKRLRVQEIESQLADDPTDETARWLARVEAVPYADHPDYDPEWRP